MIDPSNMQVKQSLKLEELPFDEAVKTLIEMKEIQGQEERLEQFESLTVAEQEDFDWDDQFLMMPDYVKLKVAAGETAINRLKALHSDKDCEMEHMQADAVLCDLLTTLGYSHVVSEWEKVRKWYA